MLQITTESGAVYLWDAGQERVKRVEGPEILNGDEWGDEWQHRIPISWGVKVGFPVYWVNAENRARITTPVTKIEEV